jgi:hypothetical protein
MVVNGAYPSATTGPTLAVFDNMLYLAWVTTSNTVWWAQIPVSDISLPYLWSSAAWIQGPITSVAPALGAYSPVGNASLAPALYLAWTTASAPYQIEFLGQTVLDPVWTAGPTPALSGTLAYLSPALTGYSFGGGCGDPTSNFFTVAYTLTNAAINLATVAQDSISSTCRPLQ